MAKVFAAPNRTNRDHLEVMISAENIGRGPEHVLATLLHELAHAANLADGISDCNVNGRHNKLFAARAKSYGLDVEVPKDAKWRGYTQTTLNDTGRERYADALQMITAGVAASARAFHASMAQASGGWGTLGGMSSGAGGKATSRAKRGDRNLTKAVCACGHSLRMSKGALAASTPVCSVCEKAFTAV